MSAACAAGVAACAILPFANPDLFWHLSAARRIVETGAIPQADWLSFTRAGVPWVDFEWGAQLLWLFAFRAAGWGGLLALKAALFGAAGAALWRVLGLHGLARGARAAWLLAWALALLPANDLRPEAFSLALFAWLWWWLERDRLRPARATSVGELATAAALGALWANLHAGFAYGLLLLALSALCAESGRRGRLTALAAAAAAGTLANPAGWRLYPVLIEHARASEPLAAVIREWQAPTLRDPWLWPFWGLLFLSFGAILEAHWKGRLPRLHALAVCLFGLSAARHVRTVPYFVAVAAPAAAAALASAGRRGRAALGLCATGALLAFCALKVATEVRLRPFVPRFAPEGVAAFLESEAATLGGRRMVHPMEWGGFLGWRLGARFPIYADGRYIFHDLVRETQEALKDPDLFRRLLDRERAEVVLLKADLQRVEVFATLKEGRTLVLSRPAWLFFVPRPQWALLYFDDQAMAFARRSAVGAAWLKAREYTLFRPGDEAGAKLMIREGDARAETLSLERERHSRPSP